ncbi:unnamed protein product [Rotaria socialis]
MLSQKNSKTIHEKSQGNNLRNTQHEGKKQLINYMLSHHCEKTKTNIIEACTEFFALDGRAFDVTRGVGFQNLVKILVEVGQLASKSKFEVTDILPHPTTISKSISRFYCIIVDQWTETHTGTSYCGVALRYATDDFQLFTFILGCFPYNAASHSAQYLREFVNKVLAEYKLVLGTTKISVTDNEAKC